jgi:Cyclophilin type peptidyl-prolyl cis-trans isomerase/CLD
LTVDKIVRAKQAVANLRARDTTSISSEKPTHTTPLSSMPSAKKVLPYNAAVYTTGKSAASFTSTALDLVTSTERALISEEDYMLVTKRIDIKGYASIQTNFGKINVELFTDYAPRAVYNFVKLSQQGYYRGTLFHRNVRNFMVDLGLSELTPRFKEVTQRGQAEVVKVFGKKSFLMNSTPRISTIREGCLVWPTKVEIPTPHNCMIPSFVWRS